MPVASDSSPLIALSSIKRLTLLSSLFESVVIPEAVAREIARSIPTRPAWLQIRTLGSPLPAVVLRSSLGDGEQEAIALAIEQRADPLILDDLPARRLASVIGIKVIGTAGVLLAAKRRGFISQIRPELDSLLSNSFFLSSQLYKELLEAADETE